MADVVIPDLIEPIRAWRFFLHVPRQLYLRSTNIVSVEWLPQETMIASCMRRVRRIEDRAYEWHPRNDIQGDIPHHPSTSYCHPGCGLYSLKSVDPGRVNPNRHLLLRLLHKEKRSSYVNLVYAEVEIWGRVIEHEWGYRSEFARILRVPNGQRVPKALQKRYQVKDE